MSERGPSLFSLVRIDLHLHSTASDGSLSPSALAWAARSGGLDVIAIADHDTTAGIREAVQSMPGNLHVIPAVELSCTYVEREVHILGYFIDPDFPDLLRYADGAVNLRVDRMNAMLARLADLRIHITLDEVIAAAEPGTRVLGRPHLARALLKRGFVTTVAEAFDRFIGDQGPAFVPTRMLEPCEAIQLIHAAGGIAVWAHPRSDAFLRDADTYVGWGLDGIECYRPRSTPQEIAQFEEYAHRNGLLLSGGSDWHGVWQGRLGDFFLSPDEVGALLERGGM